MSIRYSVVSGHGFLLTTNEAIELAERWGWPAEDYDEAIDTLAQDFGFEYCFIGDTYEDSVVILVGSFFEYEIFDAPQVVELTRDPKLDKIMEQLGINKHLGYYAGVYVS